MLTLFFVSVSLYSIKHELLQYNIHILSRIDRLNTLSNLNHAHEKKENDPAPFLIAGAETIAGVETIAGA